MEENLPPPQIPVNPIPDSAPVSPSPVPPIQPPNLSKRFPLNLILIIALVVAILSVIILSTVKNQPNKQAPPPSTQPSPTLTLTPSLTPDPTADWKTYTDKDLSISFKYPQDWKIDSSQISNNHITIYGSEDVAGKDGSKLPVRDSFYITISKNLNASGLEIKEWAKKNVKYECNPEATGSLEFKNYLVGENNAIKVKMTNNSLPLYLLLIEKGNYIWEFRVAAGFCSSPIYYEDMPIIQSYLKLTDQILSTFKFLETNQKSPVNPKGEIIQNDKECADGICILKIESGQSCGRITDAKCPTEYTCQLNSSSPDAGGKCVLGAQ